MKIKQDLKNYIDNNMRDIAISHLECWKDRYFGYTKAKLEFDLDVNHDDSLEIEQAEYELQRKLKDHEYYYLINKFHKEVVNQYINYSYNFY